MRHRVYGKHLGRDKNARTALFKNLVGSLILHGQIVTTESKAKAIKGLVDKIITQAKSKEARRLVSQFLVQKNIQDKLFKDVVPLLKERSSGYTSIIKLGNRLGDNAMKVKMSLLLKSSDKSQESSKEKSKLKSKSKNKTVILSETKDIIPKKLDSSPSTNAQDQNDKNKSLKRGVKKS
ncbi:50S ribosomal protein L17 [Candidatus Daviesbacteria bacterium RIFCSPHIGHO2_12_FULL_37_11]|uniref:50S ribosomal protein L17 n=1 Tax=Candidatus Daviesbacteria bacterium RIFCSPHIGHO2_12_FULL_37_11 TaxID=1797777 RepID=A0A1F5KCL7_9BACT|nr:MAG: 50S ribosomal protein L17 [Candidatus Daviesbacteria bacterium GWA1_38_6]OGE16445.1 MAG: 50S ribosomal protein L17 [Candidatus Daviesbacteria bacterium RIFCSPHIGHO2_01_FULL_37_27]OGE38540.1 MAG: 50S ribosomal protein L17 [Candidatus Daviesbacteria bacterium RIFCSPHIGHO2_12_FULL_37_11]OGE46135.1 MAG: 50S ribosomal protein L17 [Candidatus Daviesbacteria bacterium RIFCSPLOWO2_01_FULL_37_10]